jgi:hypothetical protein
MPETESEVFGQLRWEVFSNLDLLQDILVDEAPGISSISIFRPATLIQIPHSPQNTGSVSNTVDNILALTARPGEDADIPTHPVMRLMVEQISAASRLPRSDTAKVNFEICRPGATEQHISRHPYGYFTEPIHLDVHGEFQGSSGYVRACSDCPFHIIFLCSTRKTNNSQYRHVPSLFGRLEKNAFPHSDMGRTIIASPSPQLCGVIRKTAFIKQAASWWSVTGLVDKCFILEVLAAPNP